MRLGSKDKDDTKARPDTYGVAITQGQNPVMDIDLDSGIPRKPCNGKQRSTIGDVSTEGAEDGAVNSGAIQQNVPVSSPGRNGNAKGKGS